MQGDLFDYTGIAKPGFPHRFACILADPPWLERGGGKSCRGAQGHYPLMKTSAIAALPVERIACPDAHLWMWATDTFFCNGDALLVADAWGFRPVADFPWVKMKDGKLQTGIGQYGRKCHEHLLLCVRGAAMVPPPAARLASVIIAPRTRHSEKPSEGRRRAELVSPGPRLELFARTPHRGWTVLGNQAAGGEVQVDCDIADQLWALADGMTLKDWQARERARRIA
jgi:N6-adenosine-specific RNA methylase IME4